ncbi:MAG: hypothetical protein K9N05_06655 [Candidatus Marinimicrobia bacterium]|nr:hypothetical protein [Candidatus Neomarinimicrobiota bacterium]
MAASCLLIHKTGTDRSAFNKICGSAKELLNEKLGIYFKEIEYISPDENSFLILFKKDDISKYLSTEKGWIHYEGTVFALNETKVHTIESLWKLYQSSPDLKHFANSLDGHFVIKIYDADKNSYFVINDFIKNKTQYFTESEECYLYSSFSYLSAMIKEPKADLNAINEFMWRYYILTERSLLQETERMMPASIHHIHDNKLNSEIYWTWPDHYSNTSFQQQVESAKENMRETARLLGENFSPHLDFTQGQDSRQNIAALLDQKQLFSTSIFGKEEFDEVRQSTEMAKRFGIDHHNITLEEDFTLNPLKYFDQAILLGSGEEPGHQLGRILYMREKQGVYGNALCNGMDGHFYKNGLWDEMYTFNFYREPKSFPVDMFLNLRMMSSDYDATVFTDDIQKIKNNSKSYFHNMISGSLKGLENAPISIQADRFDLTHWLNFGLVANSASNTIVNAFSPLLFRRNLEPALQVPVKWKFNLSKFQRALVHGLHPKLAAEKTDFGGVTMTPKNIFTYIPFLLRYGWHQSGRLRNKILRKIGFHPRTHLQDAWDYTPIYKRLYEQMRDNGYLDQSIEKHINKQRWDALCSKPDQIHNTPLSDYEFIFKIVSLNTFYRQARTIYNKINNP